MANEISRKAFIGKPLDHLKKCKPNKAYSIIKISHKDKYELFVVKRCLKTTIERRPPTGKVVRESFSMFISDPEVYLKDIYMDSHTLILERNIEEYNWIVRPGKDLEAYRRTVSASRSRLVAKLKGEVSHLKDQVQILTNKLKGHNLL